MAGKDSDNAELSPNELALLRAYRSGSAGHRDLALRMLGGHETGPSPAEFEVINAQVRHDAAVARALVREVRFIHPDSGRRAGREYRRDLRRLPVEPPQAEEDYDGS